jgi:hypothetical protein
MTELGTTEHFQNLKEDGGFFYYVTGAQNANPGCPYTVKKGKFFCTLAEYGLTYDG